MSSTTGLGRKPPASVGIESEANRPHGWTWSRALLLSLGIVGLIVGGTYLFHESNTYETNEDDSAFPNTMQNVQR